MNRLKEEDNIIMYKGPDKINYPFRRRNFRNAENKDFIFNMIE